MTKLKYVYPPESLLIVGDEPRLVDNPSNEDLIEWSVDLRESYRGLREKLLGVKAWKEGLQEEE